jgi:hypothetical protein
MGFALEEILSFGCDVDLLRLIWNRLDLSRDMSIEWGAWLAAATDGWNYKIRHWLRRQCPARVLRQHRRWIFNHLLDSFDFQGLDEDWEEWKRPLSDQDIKLREVGEALSLFDGLSVVRVTERSVVETLDPLDQAKWLLCSGDWTS